MARKCPSCGNENDDSRLFCSACGEPLDPDVRLAQSLKKEAKVASQHAATAATVKTDTRKASPSRYDDDDDDYVPHRTTQKKESSAAPWIILGVLAVAAVVVVFMLIK